MRQYFLTFFLFLLSPLAQIQAETTGSFEFNYGSFPEKNTNEAYDFKANLRYKKTFSKNLALNFAPEIHYNRFKDSNGNNFFLRTKNTGLFFKKKNYFLSAGLLTHKFGLTEGLSPINFIDTFYYASPSSAETIASPTLRLMYKKKKVRAFLSYFPYRFENVYPGSRSPWIPKKAPSSFITDIDQNFLPAGVTADEAEILFPDEVLFSFQDSTESNNALKNNIAAGLRFEGKIWSSQIIFYNGLDTNANLQPSLNLITQNLGSNPIVLSLDGNEIGVIPTNERISRLGYGVKYVTPIKWRLFYEGSISKGESNTGQQNESRNTNTAGLEWGVPVGDTLIVGILQAYFSSSSNDSRLGLVSPLNEAYIVAAKWNSSNNKTDLGLTYLKSEAIDINLINISAGYSFSKKIEVNLNASLIDGNVSELLSGIIDSDYFSLNLKTHF